MSSSTDLPRLPKLDQSRTETPVVAPIVPSHLDFATEVKADRLGLLWKLTLIAASIMLIFMMTLMTFIKDFDYSVWVGAPAAISVGSIVTRFLLKRERFTQAAWAYTLGMILSVSVALLGGGEVITRIVPFMFVIAVFISGLLLRPSSMFAVTALCVASTVILPIVTGQWQYWGTYQLAAIFFMFLAAALAAQVTGELYAVTEWAILNYQRERRTNNELFDNRQKLELSLKRSEALGDRLKMVNVDLENARASAEAAKNFRGKFLANMSHELRTPLNAIIGFSETMLKFPIMYDDVELPDAYRADMNQIYTSGKQLLTLINDILDLSKVDAGKLELMLDRVDMKPLIEQAVATAQGLIGDKHIVMNMELPSEIPSVRADANRVRQILLNLYSNAVKFTDQGEIVLSVYKLPKFLQISVRDTGSGIPIDSHELIFEEFKQAATTKGRDPRSGSGLGLAISKQLISMMGGNIWVESEVGKGSIFSFTLPYYTAEDPTRPLTAPISRNTYTSPNSTNDRPTDAVNLNGTSPAISDEKVLQLTNMPETPSAELTALQETH